MKTEDIKKMAQAWNQVQEASYGKKKEAMDPVDAKELKGKHKDRKDKDIDNDGDVDKSDEYLHKRRKAVSKAIKGKESETEVQTQESVELDENKMLAPAFHRVIKAHKYESDASGKNHTWPQGDRSTKIKHNGTHVVTYNQHDGSKVHKTPASLNKHLNALHDHEVDMKSVQESVELDELSKKTLGNYVKAAQIDVVGQGMDLEGGNAKAQKAAKRAIGKRYRGVGRAVNKLTKEAKDHGNMNNGSPRGEGLSPSAKKELARTTPMPDAVNEPVVDKKTFDAIRASGKKAPMRSNDNAQGDKTMPKNNGK